MDLLGLARELDEGVGAGDVADVSGHISRTAYYGRFYYEEYIATIEARDSATGILECDPITIACGHIGDR